MNLFLCVTVYTANILGIFTDPFEFEGDYGPEVNPIRQKVFEQIVSKEALSKNLTDSQIKALLQNNDASEFEIHAYKEYLIKESIKKDKEHGPTLSELISSDLIKELQEKQKKIPGFSKNDLTKILEFLNDNGNKKAFYFFRNNPPGLLSLDKTLRDKASREGKNFNLPILSSTTSLTGKNSFELKKNLLDAIFTEENLNETKPKSSIKNQNKDLEAFYSAAGQTFFYWAYQSLNLHLVSENDPSMIEQINQVKKIFKSTLGNPETRANSFKKQLVTTNASVVFTQESDLFVPNSLTKDNLFLSVEKQNPNDGCFIFLRSHLWEPTYKLIDIENYAPFKEGKMVALLATQKETGVKFLLASCHGHSTNAADGRLQISLVMEKFHQLSQNPENHNLQLLIGIDANTKTEEEVEDLRNHLDKLGLIATSVGPTTVKQRMVTAQHSKAGRVAIDEEDYLITLKSESGARVSLTNPTIGFKQEKPDLNSPLPNIDNPSDHYPIGATLEIK